MAFTFGGATDQIVATIAAIDSGSWSYIGWLFPTGAGGGNGGRLVDIDTSGNAAVQAVLTNSTLVLGGAQFFATTNALAIGTTVMTTSAWTCGCVTFDSSDSKCRVYVGTASNAMTLDATSVAGVGARVTSGTKHVQGNNGANTRNWAGRLGYAGLYTAVLTTAQMDLFRLGYLPLDNLQNFWPLDEASGATTVTDEKAGATGTVTGATAGAAGPPSGMQWTPLNERRVQASQMAVHRASRW